MTGFFVRLYRRLFGLRVDRIPTTGRPNVLLYKPEADYVSSPPKYVNFQVPSELQRVPAQPAPARPWPFKVNQNPDREQVLYALQRAERKLQAEADQRRDYNNAEFFAEDAERMREAQALITGVAQGSNEAPARVIDLNVAGGAGSCTTATPGQLDLFDVDRQAKTGRCADDPPAGDPPAADPPSYGGTE